VKTNQNYWDFALFTNRHQNPLEPKSEVQEEEDTILGIKPKMLMSKI
jgi:hypothetical protein